MLGPDYMPYLMLGVVKRYIKTHSYIFGVGVGGGSGGEEEVDGPVVCAEGVAVGSEMVDVVRDNADGAYGALVVFT